MIAQCSRRSRRVGLVFSLLAVVCFAVNPVASTVHAGGMPDYADMSHVCLISDVAAQSDHTDHDRPCPHGDCLQLNSPPIIAAFDRGPVTRDMTAPPMHAVRMAQTVGGSDPPPPKRLI